MSDPAPEADGVLGTLSRDDLVALLGGRVRVATPDIDAAASIGDLAAAARRIDALVAPLHDAGLRIDRIARFVGALNRRLFARLWWLSAPPALVADSCLLVMGSEGRSEQIEKTDQDNALLLRDGAAHAGLHEATRRFSQGLAALGWPPCPGDIMLTNPRWCAPLSAFRETVRDWVHGADADGPMHLAIFFDAAAVAGDASLLVELQQHLARIVAASDAFIARFGAAADQFEAPTHWWSHLLRGHADDETLDLKKLGTFPIVHGVRALCLRHGVREAGTAARIERLHGEGVLDAATARDLAEALHFLMDLKLREQRRQRAAGQAVSNLVRPSTLSTLQRDALRSTLAINRGWRALLRQRLHLEAL
jgi:CBS domain-containing protein